MLKTQPSWKDPVLVSWLQREFGLIQQNTAIERTAAISLIFLNALAEPSLNTFRPDAIWTALQNTYYRAITTPALHEFAQAMGATPPNGGGNGTLAVTPEEAMDEAVRAINAARNGWARSNGVALEKVFINVYNPMLQPQILLVLGKGELGKMTPKPINFGQHEIGMSREDDVYIVTYDNKGQGWVFGAMQVKSSVGDRLSQAQQRSENLMNAGFFSAYFTLDTMEIARSRQGMLINQQYINHVNLGGQRNPALPGFHAVYVGRMVDGRRPVPPTAQPVLFGRIIDVDMRRPAGLLVADLKRAGRDWIKKGQKLPRNWS